ncbi:MAG: hypothetical protein ACYTKD_27435 [Planctomycetota bacterium]
MEALLEQERIERRLVGWKQDHEDLTPILDSILDRNANIEGAWTTRLPPISYESSTLLIRREEGDRYVVDFSTGGCLGQWRLDREGSYAKGVFRLDRPVEEYCPRVYDTLYAVSVEGVGYLISQPSVRFVLEHYAKNGRVDWPKHIRFAAFHRAAGEGKRATSTALPHP